MSQPRHLLGALAALIMIPSASAQSEDVHLTLLAVTAPTATETVTTLPESIAHVCLGDTYFVELWVSDVGTINTGVSSAYVDLVWPGVLAEAVSVDRGTIYSTFATGTIMFGKIDELGGTALSATGVAIEPEWVRVAVVELTADAAGSVTYELQPSATGVAALGRGMIPWGEVSRDGLSLAQWCGSALLSCTPLSQVGLVSGTVTVEIMAEGVMGLNAYQVEVAPLLTSGTGSLVLRECFVDGERPGGDFAFFGLDYFSSCDANNLRLAAVASQSQAVDVPWGQPVYLGSYVFDVSGDATNGSTFEVGIQPEPDSLLLDAFGQALPLSAAEPCAITILECDAPTGFAEGCRYLQVTLNPPDSPALQAIRITSPDCPSLFKYVNGDGCLVTDPPTFKTVAEWGTVHITGEDVVPGFAYDVTALCEEVATETGASSVSARLWGDVDGDSSVEVIDIQKVVQCAEGTFHGGTTIYNADLIANCTAPECDVFDVLAILDAFRGLPYPGAVPCTRADYPADRPGDPKAPRVVDPVVTLVPLSWDTWSGDPVTIEAFVQDVADLRAYQIQLSISGGVRGAVACDTLFVDTSRPDYVFRDAGAADWPWVNIDLCRLSSSLAEGGVDVGNELRYLGTFVLASSEDSCGEFTAATEVAHSVLLDHLGLAIEFAAEEVGLPISILADTNCDCQTNALDIHPFVLAETGPDEYPNQYPDCNMDLADVNGDGEIDSFDIDPFVELLLGRAIK